MSESYEYAWIERNEAGEIYVAKTETRRRLLRTEPLILAEAETIETVLPYRHPDGRAGVLKGTVDLPAKIEPPEIDDRGPDGGPAVRLIVRDEQPDIEPWQRAVSLEMIGEAEVRYSWVVEDRPLAEVQAQRTAQVKADLQARINERLLVSDDASDIRAAGRAALDAIAAAKTAEAAWSVQPDWPAEE